MQNEIIEINTLTLTTQNLNLQQNQDILIYLAGLSINTQRTYKKAFECFYKYLSTNEITEANLIKFIEISILNNKAITSIKLQLSALQTLGLRLGYIYNSNRIKDYLRLATQKAQSGSLGKNALLKNDIKLLLNNLDTLKSIQYKRNSILIKLLYLGAFRCSEVLDLKIKDITISGDCIDITLQKTKSQKDKVCKVIIKNYDLAFEIQEYVKSNNLDSNIENYLITAISKSNKLQSKKISYTACYMLLQKLYIKSGLDFKKFATHSFRSGNVSQALNSGITLDIIKSHLRHKDISTTMRYKKDFDLVANSYSNQII